MQGVRPRREVGGWGMLGGTAQTNKLIGQKLAGGFNTEDCKAGKNGAIVCSRESPRRWGRQDPEHVLCAGKAQYSSNNQAT